MSELRVGIVGFGMIGKVHAFGYATLPFYAPELYPFPRMVRVVTSRPETAQNASRLLGIDAGVDYRDVTSADDIDIVHVCSPNDCHAVELLDAIAHNKHIYCDKPLVVSPDEADAIEEALARRDAEGKPCYTKTNQMTFHLRFYTAIQRARQLIEEGRLGRVFQYRVSYFHSSSASPAVGYKWKHSPAGGVIRDLGAHLIDLVDYLIGFPDELTGDANIAFHRRQQGTSGPSESWREIVMEDTFSILTRHDGIAPCGFQAPVGSTFVSGKGEPVTGVVEGTKLATGYEDDVRFEIHGQDGALRFSLMDAHYLEFFDGRRPDRPFGGESGWTRIACGARYESPHSTFPSAKASTGWLRGHTAALAAFIDAVKRNGRAVPDLRQGIRVQKVLADVARACHDRKWVTVARS